MCDPFFFLPDGYFSSSLFSLCFRIYFFGFWVCISLFLFFLFGLSLFTPFYSQCKICNCLLNCRVWQSKDLEGNQEFLAVWVFSVVFFFSLARDMEQNTVLPFKVLVVQFVGQHITDLVYYCLSIHPIQHLEYNAQSRRGAF